MRVNFRNTAHELIGEYVIPRKKNQNPHFETYYFVKSIYAMFKGNQRVYIDSVSQI